MRKYIVIFIAIWLMFPMKTTASDSETYLSEEIQGYCIEIGQEYGICPELLMAMIERESTGDRNAENGSCKGLMQISERWHKDRMEKLGVTDIHDEYGNILLGADYLAELREEYCEVSYVLDIYNGNSKADYNYENGILSDYAKHILERSEELERMHNK